MDITYKNIDRLRDLNNEGFVVAIKQNYSSWSYKQYDSDCGCYTYDYDLQYMQEKVKYLSDCCMGIYCIDQNLILIKDPKLAERVQEAEWPKEIKIETVADKDELIKKTQEAFQKSSYCNLY